MTVRFSLYSGSSHLSFRHPAPAGPSGHTAPQDPPLEATTAGEGGKHAQAEALVHEAVDDRIDTGRGVGKQVDKRDGSPRQAVGRAPVKRLPRVDHKDGSPAEEEEKDDDQEHADHSLFGHQVGCRAAAAAHPPHHRLAARLGRAARIRR